VISRVMGMILASVAVDTVLGGLAAVGLPITLHGA
jgi:small neutral amino acid transporter SnatA (MarC family)